MTQPAREPAPGPDGDAQVRAEPALIGLDLGGTSVRAVVTAPQFAGLSRIDQHRLVKAAIKPRFDDGSVHALSVKTQPA